MPYKANLSGIHPSLKGWCHKASPYTLDFCNRLSRVARHLHRNAHANRLPDRKGPFFRHILFFNELLDDSAVRQNCASIIIATRLRLMVDLTGAAGPEHFLHGNAV